jgi:hypothetical protein
MRRRVSSSIGSAERSRDLPKVEEMSDALGFELPTALTEPTAETSTLPFESQGEVLSRAIVEETVSVSDETVH